LSRPSGNCESSAGYLGELRGSGTSAIAFTAASLATKGFPEPIRLSWWLQAPPRRKYESEIVGF
jgi:hypothetical protein